MGALNSYLFYFAKKKRDIGVHYECDIPLCFNSIKRSGLSGCCCINDLEIHFLLIK